MGNFESSYAEERHLTQEAAHELKDLEKAVSNKLEAISYDMKYHAMDDQRLPIVAIVDEIKKIHVNVTQEASKESIIREVLESALKGAYLDGILKIISNTLEKFVGCVKVGETQQSSTNVMFAYNGVLRIDYVFYKNQIRTPSDDNDGAAQNSFCYYMQVGVLDLQKMNVQVTLYELTKAMQENQIQEAVKKLQEIGEFASELLEFILKFSEKQKQAVDRSKAIQ